MVETDRQKYLDQIFNEQVISWDDGPTRESNASSAQIIPRNDHLTAGNLATQQDAPLDLTMVSWPNDYKYPGLTKESRRREYYYDPQAGEGSFVYIMDTGVDTSHSVSSL